MHHESPRARRLATLPPVTALDLRRATIGYSERAVGAAVDAGLDECPVAEAAGDPGFAELVTFWLTDPDAWEWLVNLPGSVSSERPERREPWRPSYPS